MPIRPENRALPSAAELRRLFDYDPETGVLTWRYRPEGPKNFNTRFAGKPALACMSGNGYLHGNMDGRHAYAHRVIFKMMTGLEPPQIDHDDGEHANNRWRNLFAATALDNSHNVAMKPSNKSGRTGVHMGHQGKWVAQIRRDGKTRHLGSFASFEDACSVRAAAELEVGFRCRGYKRAA